MTGEEIISLTEEWLTSVPEIRENIRLIDAELKKNTYDTAHIEELKHERHKLHYKLSKIIRAISTLKDQDQRIFCYKYFDRLSNADAARRVGVTRNTVPYRINKYKLTLGRIMFGFEDEFWNEIYFG
jgi:DNA-directed RNA polymerase specialized sigma subunit